MAMSFGPEPGSSGDVYREIPRNQETKPLTQQLADALDSISTRRAVAKANALLDKATVKSEVEVLLTEEELYDTVIQPSNFQEGFEVWVNEGDGSKISDPVKYLDAMRDWCLERGLPITREARERLAEEEKKIKYGSLASKVKAAADNYSNACVSVCRTPELIASPGLLHPLFLLIPNVLKIADSFLRYEHEEGSSIFAHVHDRNKDDLTQFVDHVGNAYDDVVRGLPDHLTLKYRSLGLTEFSAPILQPILVAMNTLYDISEEANK